MLQLVQILGWPFLMCLIIGTILGYFGIHVLKREVIFIDIAVAQVAVVGSIAAHLVFEAEEDKIAPIENEPQAFGVAKYIKNAENGLDIEKIHRSALNASKRIEWRMIYPTKKDTIAFSVQTRSADFGKDLDVPVFRPKEKGLWNFREKIRNVNESLWPNGQICREFSFARIPIQFIYARPERERKLQKIARYFQRLSRASIERKSS